MLEKPNMTMITIYGLSYFAREFMNSWHRQVDESIACFSTFVPKYWKTFKVLQFSQLNIFRLILESGID